jgi:hypothetical protein
MRKSIAGLAVIANERPPVATAEDKGGAKPSRPPANDQDIHSHFGLSTD